MNNSLGLIFWPGAHSVLYKCDDDDDYDVMSERAGRMTKKGQETIAPSVMNIFTKDSRQDVDSGDPV